MIGVGEIFCEERQRQGLTIADVSKKTKIRESFLTAIEKGEYAKLPSRAYAFGFVRNYAKFLGFPEQKTLALFRREFNEEKIYKVMPDGLVRHSYSSRKIKMSDSMMAILIAFLLLLMYLLFQYRYAIVSPPLEIQRPKDGSILKDSNVMVAGKTDSSAEVFVNNESVALDSEGNFKKTLNLFSGKNTIVIKVVNRFGKQTIKTEHINIKTQ